MKSRNTRRGFTQQIVNKTGHSRGFTLIELLVTVLIIAILAAVAVPQYQKAVVKSWVFSYLPFVKSLVAAQEAYYLANGQYALFFEDLDVDLASCQLLWEGSSYPYRNLAHCGDSILIDNSIASSVSNGYFTLQYCPKNATSYNKCVSTTQRIYLTAYFQHSTNTERAGKWYCGASYSLGEKICDAFNAQYQ